MEYNKKCISSRFLKLTYPTFKNSVFIVSGVKPKKEIEEDDFFMVFSNLRPLVLLN